MNCWRRKTKELSWMKIREQRIRKWFNKNEEVHFGESQQREIHEPDAGKEERLANNLMEDENQHTDVATKEVGGNSGQHTNLFS